MLELTANRNQLNGWFLKTERTLCAHRSRSNFGSIKVSNLRWTCRSSGTPAAHVLWTGQPEIMIWGALTKELGARSWTKASPLSRIGEHGLGNVGEYIACDNEIKAPGILQGLPQTRRP